MSGDKVLVPREFIEFVRTAPVSSGTCCCGASMEDHPEAMECGHAPTDQWDWSLHLWLEQIKEEADGEAEGAADRA